MGIMIEHNSGLLQVLNMLFCALCLESCLEHSECNICVCYYYLAQLHWSGLTSCHLQTCHLLPDDQRSSKSTAEREREKTARADGARGDRENQTDSDYSLKVGVTVFPNGLHVCVG